MAISPPFLDFSHIIFQVIQDRVETEEVDVSQLNWIQFHRVNMLFYQHSKANPKKYPFHPRLEQYAIQQVIKNKAHLQEWTRLATRFALHQIPILPHKGLIWQFEWYGNKPRRDISDMDIWVPPSHAAQALQLLHQDGYTSASLPSLDTNVINEVVKLAPNPEVSLVKQPSKGTKISLDFHWGIRGIHGPELSFQEVWEEAKPWSLGGMAPSTKHQFQLLLIHHGSKDTWMHLKTVIDLYHFLNWCQTDNQTLIQWASELNLAESFLQGRYLLFQLGWMPEPAQPPNNLPNVHRILSFWQKTRNWKSTEFKWHHHVMMRNSYFPPLSWWQMGNDLLNYHGHYSKLDQDRWIKFPQHWRLMNVISKYGTYLFRK